MAGAPTRIVSGGRSGVDRAALDVAASRGLDFGGGQPRGGWAEDFPDPPGRSDEISTPEGNAGRWPKPAHALECARKRCDADPRRIGYRRLAGFTLACAVALLRPHRVLDLLAADAIRAAREWTRQIAPATQNVAGPRESESPGVYRAAEHFLEDLF